MQSMEQLGAVVYFILLLMLSGYGLHRYLMLYLYYRHRGPSRPPATRFATLPVVTVQLPLYNESYVAERLLDAVAKLDYPRTRLEIQVLDDSTDNTPALVARRVTALRAAGLDIHHIRRPDREGFKAGALEHGLRSARGEFIAIFDADFVPSPDLLQRLIHYFSEPGVGMLQARWGHLNERYSLLTQVQSILLDAHFLIEQTARSRSGRFFNFNGTAGVWRRQCIVESGGWHSDTLAEDLDLSYRAQIRGWKFVFLPDVVVPAELPVEMNAFKTQQHRWAKGSVQTCKKMLPELWRSPLPLKIKLEGTVHLTSNFGYLLLLILCCLFRAAASASTLAATGGNTMTRLVLVDLPLFLAASGSVMAFYICAQKELHTHWWRRLAYVPLMMAVGIGLCVNNARAVLEAVFNHQTDFVRTPKYGGGGAPRAVPSLRGLIPYVELALAGYFSLALADCISSGRWAMLPFVIIMQSGFLYVGLMSLGQAAFGRVFRPGPVLASA